MDGELECDHSCHFSFYYYGLTGGLGKRIGGLLQQAGGKLLPPCQFNRKKAFQLFSQTTKSFKTCSRIQP